VGKSTLVNALLGRTEQETGAIREDDDRGRHTTTSRRLIQLPSGALVIDTPGMREIQLEAGHDEGLEKSFGSIENLARSCRFSNCLHESEPGCAVKAALVGGEITEGDLESYRKLKKEIAFQERKNSPAALSQQKKDWKKRTLGMRDVHKRKGR
jgi:ribosome biogenesis GTPase